MKGSQAPLFCARNIFDLTLHCSLEAMLRRPKRPAQHSPGQLELHWTLRVSFVVASNLLLVLTYIVDSV